MICTVRSEITKRKAVTNNIKQSIRPLRNLHNKKWCDLLILKQRENFARIFVLLFVENGRKIRFLLQRCENIVALIQLLLFCHLTLFFSSINIFQKHTKKSIAGNKKAI